MTMSFTVNLGRQWQYPSHNTLLAAVVYPVFSGPPYRRNIMGRWIL